MDIDDAAEIAFEAMHNISDYDTSLHMFARAAVKALGWRNVKKELPDFDDTVVCTDSKHRWLDMRTTYSPNLQWQGHTATHWHPIMNIEDLA